MRHEDRRGRLTQQVVADAAEQGLEQPRMTEGAGDDQVGVLSVEAGEQGFKRRDIAGVGPVGDLGGDAMARQVVGKALGPSTAAMISEKDGWFIKGVLLNK